MSPIPERIDVKKMTSPPCATNGSYSSLPLFTPGTGDGRPPAGGRREGAPRQSRRERRVLVDRGAVGQRGNQHGGRESRRWGGGGMVAAVGGDGAQQLVAPAGKRARQGERQEGALDRQR